MNRTAQVAYTPRGASNVNRLRRPEYGLVSLVLKTGCKTSKSHLPDGAPRGPACNDGTDDFCFAPEKEIAQLVYQLHDPLFLVRQAKLELFVRFRREPVWTLDLGTFGPSWRGHGEHAIQWDGRIVQADRRRDDEGMDGKFAHSLCDIPADLASADFPDGYVTLEHTSYKLKMTVGADGISGEPATAWTYFHVLVDRIELEFGPPEVLPIPVPGQGDHRSVYADLLGRHPKPPSPSESKPVKVFLDSDVYQQPVVPLGLGSSEERRFESYRRLWDQGPLIPLFAKVLIRDSGDRGVDSPKAIGRAKFLWEWESMGEQVATGRASDEAVNEAQSYRARDSRPRGQNCHVDQGGKRGTPSLPVFPAQAGYPAKEDLDDGVFPFEVAPVPERRTWAAYSYAWRAKALAGKTGVLFQPSRMAGDAYKVSVYLAWDVGRDGKNRLDTEEQPLVVPSPDRAAAGTGTFQIWRRIHWRKPVAKTDAGMLELALDEITRCFAAGFLEIVDNACGPPAPAPTDWDTAIARATAGWDETSRLFLAPGPQQPETAGIAFRSRGEFCIKWREREIARRLSAIGYGEHGANIAAVASTGASANAASDLATATAASEGYDEVAQAHLAKASHSAWNWVERRMSQPPLHTRASYALLLQQKAIDLLTAVCNASADEAEGISVFQVARVHNLCSDLPAMTLAAPQRQDPPNPHRCGILLMSAWGEPRNVLAHEIARRLFLSRHESGQGPCLMSSEPGRVTELCGACQLRLRGWMGDLPVRPVEPGSYTLTSNLECGGAEPQSNPLTFDVERPAMLSCQLLLGPGLGRTSLVQAFCLLSTPSRPREIRMATFRFDERLEAFTLMSLDHHAVPPEDADEVIAPGVARAYSPENPLPRPVCRAGKRLSVLGFGDAGGAAIALPFEPRVVRPALATTDGGQELFVVDNQGKRMALVRFPSEESGDDSLPLDPAAPPVSRKASKRPQLLWTMSLPVPIASARAALTAPGGIESRHAVLVGDEPVGARVLLVDAADGTRCSGTSVVSLPGWHAAQNAEPGLHVDTKGRARAALIVHSPASADGSVDVALADLTWESRRSNPRIEITPLTKLAAVPHASTVTYTTSTGGEQRAWMVLTSDGQTMSSGDPPVQRLSGRPVLPLDLLLTERLMAVLTVDSAGVPEIVTLNK